jgi:hypothetical protein
MDMACTATRKVEMAWARFFETNLIHVFDAKQNAGFKKIGFEPQQLLKKVDNFFISIFLFRESFFGRTNDCVLHS